MRHEKVKTIHGLGAWMLLHPTCLRSPKPLELGVYPVHSLSALGVSVSTNSSRIALAASFHDQELGLCF